ncbi:RING finger protein 4 [Latimeria chalumnae]|uniref:RING finger protein 4 n=1 Tax=Latimeria chalumnae TaxID=7897 RepID=UPI00313C1136
MSTTQRKRSGGEIENTRRAHKRQRPTNPSAAMATENTTERESIEVEESVGEEVVDLTCESTEPVVVDLTHNDSVVIVEDHQACGRQENADSCVLSSDDDDIRENVTSNVTEQTVLLEESSSRSSWRAISCPICMDGYAEIVQSGRLIVSTKCGHVFCSQCLRDTLKNASSCPTCRKKLNHKQYHPLYI